MEAVGYDMYVKLLNEAVSLMKGEEPARPVDQECLVDMQVQAHIPESYIDSSEPAPGRVPPHRRGGDPGGRHGRAGRAHRPVWGAAGLGEGPAGRGPAAEHRRPCLGVAEVKQQGDSLLVYKEKFDVGGGGAPLIKALGGRVLLSAGSRPYISVKLAGPAPHRGPLREVLDRHAGNRSPRKTVRHFTISV